MLPRGPRVRRRLNAAAFAGGFGAPRRSSVRTTPSGGGSSQSTPRNSWLFLLCGLRGLCVERRGAGFTADHAEDAENSSGFVLRDLCGLGGKTVLLGRLSPAHHEAG